MSHGKYIICLAIASVALLGLLALIVSPAAASTWVPKLTGEVANGSTYTYNGCFIRFDLSADSGFVFATVNAVGHQTRTLNIPAGNFGDYDNLVRIYVSQVNRTSDKIWVEIAVPSDSEATPTPTSGGTKLTCETPGLQALAGDTVVFPIAIQNNDNEDKTYTLTASSGTGWGLRFVSGDKGLYKLYVPSMSSKTVNLEVKTTGATGVGEKKVTATVDGQNIDVYVYVTSVNQSAEVSATVSSKIAAIGETITYDIQIRNLQTQENIYRLSASGLAENWYYRFKDSAASTQELAEVVVPEGGTKSLVLEIVPSLSATAGDYNFTATVTEPSGNAISKNFMLRLKSGVGMTMQSPKLAFDARPGQTFSFDVYVANSGSGTALTNVYLEATAPSGWTVQVTPNKTASLTAGNTQRYTVKVTPPGNIVASDYDITIKAKSDQAEKEKDYRITVTVDSYIPYIGGAIILFVLVGLALVYRKYGRR